MSGARSFAGPLLAAGLALPVAALAQRAEENALIAAQDAFGTMIGAQSVGLYSPEDARGFSPHQAGNLRIEGLYFDQQTWESGACMVRETTMRVGIAAQSYSFPAPTGVVDLSLRTPGDKAILSAVLARGPFTAATADLEAQLPLSSTLGAEVCAGYHRNFAEDVFRESRATVLGTTWRWRPVAGTEVIPFVSYTGGGARQIVPVVYTDGTVPLPNFRTRDLNVEDYTTWGWNQTNFGVIVKSGLGGPWALAAGLFHSRENDPLGYDPYMTLLAAPPGHAEYVMDAAPAFVNDSTSGEVRLSRTFTRGTHQEQLQFAVRGRAVEREFGGDVVAPAVIIPFPSQAHFPAPALNFAPANRDSTRQLDLGVTFEELWQGGSFALGVLNDHYRRTVRMPGGLTDTDQTSPWLMNLRLAVNASRHLILYGSYVQGLEDSAVAPVSAANRNEPPPATRTWQVDGGMRYAPSEQLQLILGAFEIHKPYFNTGADNLYRQLGQLQYRGLETSLSYAQRGLTVLLGGVLLRPRVERVVPEPGATGDVPLGPVPLTLTANLDYAPPQWGPWGASVQWNRLASRVATTDNADYLPALSTLAAGVRCHWVMHGRPWNLRFDAFNLTDAQGLHVSSLEVLLPEQRRRFMLTLATDQ